MEQTGNGKKKFSVVTATAVVIANMVGVGVLTSLGFQVAGITSGIAIISLWLLGGVIALFGAFCYAELGVAIGRSGGEYSLLAAIYHPGLGFTAGWISFLIGFAAPTAATAMILCSYLNASLSFFHIAEFIPSWMTDQKAMAVFFVVILTFVHSASRRRSAIFQNFTTWFSIALLSLLVVVGFLAPHNSGITFTFDSKLWADLISPAFAISLYFVAFSYSGWNAAAYIAGEIENPQKNIPIALLLGTLVVTVLYILLNLVFLLVVPIPDMAGRPEVGAIFAHRVGGETAGAFLGLLIAIKLLASMSSMMITGPRVTKVIGDDVRLFRWFHQTNQKEIPVRAVVTQGVLTVAYIYFANFESMITYIGFTLNLFLMLTVAGVFVHRYRFPEAERPYKTFGYPFVPGLFLVMNFWILVYGLIFKPVESFWGLGIAALGGLIYYIGSGKKKK